MSLLDAKAERLWGVVGRNKATDRLAHFLMTFGFAPSSEDAMRRVQRQCANNPQWRKKYEGWIFSPFLADLCFEIKHGGATLMYKNDKEEL